jgi:hypothetical protein
LIELKATTIVSFSNSFISDLNSSVLLLSIQVYVLFLNVYLAIRIRKGNTQKQARQLRNKQRKFAEERCQTIREEEKPTNS